MALVTVAAHPTEAKDRTTLRLEISVPSNSGIAREVIANYRKVFAQLGYKLDIEYYPGKRGLIYLESGKVDGTVGRTFGLRQRSEFKKLIRINYPVAYLTISLWCRDHPAKLHQAQPSRPLYIGYREGANWTQASMTKINTKVAAGYPLNSTEHAIKMLAKGHIDCYVSPLLIDEANGPKLTRILKSMPFRWDLTDLGVYMYLQPKYQALQKPLETMLVNAEFSAKWRQRYRQKQSSCGLPQTVLCPDGFVFQHAVPLHLEPLAQGAPEQSESTVPARLQPQKKPPSL
jgi:hypothetical protein